MTEPPSTTDILIAGGSYAGLALAAALSHHSGGDLAITVVSPAFPRTDIAASEPIDTRASALSRGSLDMLEQIGVWPSLQSDAQIVQSITITDSALHDSLRPAVLTYDLTGDHRAASTLPAMVIVENHCLGAALYERAHASPRVTLLGATAISSFVTEPGHVSAVLENGRTMQARLLIAADGARSKLRDTAAIKTIGWPYAQRGIVTIVAPELPHDGRATQHFLPGGPFAILPMTGNRMCVTWTEDAGEATRILALEPADFRVEVERRFGHELGTLQSISPPRTWPLAMCVARTLTAPRFALVGDAAHTVHPIAGQGLNLGFRDVAALTSAIIDAARLGLDFGAPAPLERFERERRFDNLACATAFDALNRLFSTKSTLARSARGAVLGVADSLPGLKAWLIAEASGA